MGTMEIGAFAYDPAHPLTVGCPLCHADVKLRNKTVAGGPWGPCTRCNAAVFFYTGYLPVERAWWQRLLRRPARQRLSAWVSATTDYDTVADLI